MKNIYLLILSISIFSCVSIKPSTVELSANVGARISEMEKLHQLAIQRYFDAEKQKIENFLNKTWEPLFLKNFLGTSNVLALLQNVSKIDASGTLIIKEGIAIYLTDPKESERAAQELIGKLSTSRKGEDTMVRSVLSRFINDDKLDAAVIHISSLLGTDEPARIIFDFAEAAHEEMLKQRNELLAPIEQMRLEISSSLSESYAELIRGQSTITGRLEAAAKRSKQQDELMGKLGIADISQNVTKKLSDFSSKVSAALSGASLNKSTDSESVISTLKKALNN
ncbi:MAG: hypothetical protein ABI844_01525 [Saprospiraceae bacterium]